MRDASSHIESNPLPPDGNDDAVSLLVCRNHAKPALIERDHFGCLGHVAQHGRIAKLKVKSEFLGTDPAELLEPILELVWCEGGFPTAISRRTQAHFPQRRF